MTGNQARYSIIENTNIYWSVIFEFDIDGEEFITFLSGTNDRKQWGGARQITIFAKMENIKIAVHSHGNAMHTFNYESDDEQNKSTINLLCCNIKKWGAQPNHHDLLHPIEGEAKTEK
eukprot:13831706-Heterocapsa_arctica.AAC.1